MESESCWSNLITKEPELRTLSSRQNEDLCQSAILSSTPKEEDPVESMTFRTYELATREDHVFTRSLPKNRDMWQTRFPLFARGATISLVQACVLRVYDNL